MGKIPNWTRRKDMESKDYPFVWEHEDVQAYVVAASEDVLLTDPGEPIKYEARLFEIENPKENWRDAADIVAQAGSKDEIRERSVDWMRDHLQQDAARDKQIRQDVLDMVRADGETRESDVQRVKEELEKHQRVYEGKGLHEDDFALVEYSLEDAGIHRGLRMAILDELEREYQ